VKGRYYFSPPETPVFGGVHILGSKTWDNNVWVDPTPYGQVWSESSNWVPGELPGEVPDHPENATIKCLAAPSSIANSIPYDETIDGWPAACFGLPEGTLNWHLFTSYERCSVQLLWAWVTCELYDDNQAIITTVLSQLLDDDVAYTYVPRLVFYPRLMIAVCPRYCLVASEGTANEQQIALQGMTDPLGPTNIGAFSTVPLWYLSGLRIVSALTNAGYVAGTPIFFAGHSYGGVSVLVAAAILRIANRNTKIRYLTYGCPAIGDARFTDKISQCEGICIGNTTDIVPALPFGLQELGTALPLVGPLLVARLASWDTAPRQALMHSDGRLSLRSRYVPIGAVIAQIYVDIATGVALGPIIAHPIAEYMRRIILRCPNPNYPILDEAVYTQIQNCVAEGITCNTAIEITAGSPMTRDSNYPSSLWFRGNVIAGNIYFFKCENPGFTVDVCHVYQGGSCSALTLIGDIDEGGCFWTNLTSGDDIFFHVTFFSSSPSPFTVLYGLGVCP
jgi:hypothetical protein